MPLQGFEHDNVVLQLQVGKAMYVITTIFATLVSS